MNLIKVWKSFNMNMKFANVCYNECRYSKLFNFTNLYKKSEFLRLSEIDIDFHENLRYYIYNKRK